MIRYSSIKEEQIMKIDNPFEWKDVTTEDFKILMVDSDSNLSFDDYYNRVTSKKYKLVKQKITLQ